MEIGASVEYDCYRAELLLQRKQILGWEIIQIRNLKARNHLNISKWNEMNFLSFWVSWAWDSLLKRLPCSSAQHFSSGTLAAWETLAEGALHAHSIAPGSRTAPGLRDFGAGLRVDVLKFLQASFKHTGGVEAPLVKVTITIDLIVLLLKLHSQLTIIKNKILYK